jgi:hypothetical protein
MDHPTVPKALEFLVRVAAKSKDENLELNLNLSYCESCLKPKTQPTAGIPTKGQQRLGVNSTHSKSTMVPPYLDYARGCSVYGVSGLDRSTQISVAWFIHRHILARCARLFAHRLSMEFHVTIFSHMAKPFEDENSLALSDLHSSDRRLSVY